jgi:fructosamine-3-kinase
MTYSKDFINEILKNALDDEIQVSSISSISGGCIHNAQKISTNKGLYFVKLNRDTDVHMFETEYAGLELLAEANELDVPKPLAFGIYSGQAYLILEFIESQHRKNDFWIDFGRSLANLHLKHKNDQYGLNHNNYIGRLDQFNDFHKDWITFFIDQRLEVQLKMAFNNSYIDEAYLERFGRFYKQLPGLLPVEPPSLLHGDLWSGNFMIGANGQPVIIDPAIYYGNREIELSFTQMFGGFDRLFYDSYFESFPLAPGFDDRVEIYNIYPHLVHVNLFGASYLGGVTSVLRKYT